MKSYLEGVNKRKKVDIILLNTPILDYKKKKVIDYLATAPLGLGYLATIAKEKGHNVGLLDAEAKKVPIEIIIKAVNGAKPKILGINLISANYALTKKIIKGINPEIFIIAGGPHATLRAKDVLKQNKNINVVLRGEGEEAWAQFLNKFPNYENINGFTYRKDKSIVCIGQQSHIKNLDSLPFIDRNFFSNDPYYKDNLKEVSISTARGCPGCCSFCSVPVINGRRVRARSFDNIIQEIKSLEKKYGIDSVHFTDDNFTFDQKWITNLCKALVKEKLNIKWRALARVNDLDEDLLLLMKKAGCYMLAIGVESGSERTLKIINKTINRGHLLNVLDVCKKQKIKTKGFFTIGYPHETKKEIEDTITFACELPLDEACFTAVRAFPETPLYNSLLEKGFTKKQLDSYHQFYDKDCIDYKLTKYHVANKVSISNFSLQFLDKCIKKANKLFCNTR
ncbi:radical SAM protein [archaeon]|nr:radical SAM protein [archaeon]MBT4416785.1 radical SAM protein [archaeon]